MINVKVLSSTDKLNNNTYIVSDKNQAIIIDPSINQKEAMEFLTKHKLKLVGILITHGHYDHVGHSRDIVNEHHVSIYMHEKDKIMFKHNLLSRWREWSLDHFNFFNKSFELGNFKIEIINAPGHTPGSTLYKINNYLFTGDVLLRDFIGRDDLPESNPEDTLKTAKMLMKLDESLIVMPGHYEYGEKLKEIKKNNSELIEAAKQ